MLISFLAAAEQVRPKNENNCYEDWIAEIAKGNTESLAALYTETKSAVYGFALSIVKNPQVAEDVMQDTFVRIFHSAGTYRPEGKPVAWILTITRNLCLMRLRKNREIPGAEVLPDTTPSGTDHAAQTVDRMVLNAAMESLSDTSRQILILHSVSGLKHREIAEILQIPLSTVLSKYYRALSKLKMLLKEELI